MTTLVDLMDTEAPNRVEVTGKRLSGSVSVLYGRSSHLTPVIRFGGDRFNLGDSIVVANGVECEVAGLDFYRLPDGTWRTDTYGNVRRHVDYSKSGVDFNVTHKTAWMIHEALAAKCADLYELYPDAFVRLGVGNSYQDAQSFDKAVEQATNDLRVTQAFAKLYRLVEDGDAIVVAPESVEMPDEVCWEHPSRDAMPNHDCQRGRGRVVGIVTSLGKLVGYAVDRSGTPHKPDTYHGPLLVPVELARYPKDRHDR